MKVLTELRGKPHECETTHHVECPCIVGFLHKHKRARYFKIIDRWQQVVTDVSNMEEFNRKVNEMNLPVT